MHYVTEHWSFDPFLVVVMAVIAAHEVGLARLRARSVPARTRRRRFNSLAFYGGLVLMLDDASDLAVGARDREHILNLVKDDQADRPFAVKEGGRQF